MQIKQLEATKKSAICAWLLLHRDIMKVEAGNVEILLLYI